MKTFKKALCLVLTVLACAANAVHAEIFMLPQGIKTLESEALSGVSMPDGILLPESLTSIAADAFGDTVVYGISGGRAEAYALSRGLMFKSIDIGEITIDVPAYASPYRAFTVKAAADSVLPYETVFTLSKDGVVCFESEASLDGTAQVVLYEAGLYDYTVKVYNDYAQNQMTFEGETEIYEPIRLIRQRWFVREGEQFCPIDETEERKVTLTCEDGGLHISGDTISAQRLGKYTVTAVAEQDGERVYTDFEVNVVVPVQQILTGVADVELYLGESFQPKLSFQPETADPCEVRFASSNPEIAAVDENGLITAIMQGEANITIEAFDAKASIHVRVKQAAESLRILAPESGNTLIQGSALGLQYEVSPESADDIDVSWISSNDLVATVDAAGFVRALRPGEVSIIALCPENNSRRDEIKLSVLSATQSITAEVPKWLYVGQSAQLNIAAEPSEMLDSISVSISDESVVEVRDGKLYALSAGESSVSFTSPDHCAATYTIKVYDRLSAINGRMNDLYLNSGMSASLNDILYFEPIGCRVEGLFYASSDDSVAAVSQDGVIRAVNAGSATVNVTCGEAQFALHVHVVSDGKVISSVGISNSYLVLICGSTGALSPVISAADGQYKRGEWYSDAPEIVSVESVGSGGTATIRAQKPGTAHIYLISSSGLSASCEVLVNPVAPKSITSTMKSCALNPGETAQFVYQLSPAGADASDLTTFSSSTDVAEIDENAVIKAVGAGDCEVFLFIDDLAVSCRVHVNAVDMTEAWLCESELRGKAGESAEICYNFEPANASPARFRWTSDDSGIADVDALSGLVHFVSAGETTLRGEALDASGLKLSLRVIVEETPVRALTLSQDEFTLDAGQSAKILYSVYPHSASYAQAVFESADANIANVDESGTVTAVRSGNTDIFVTVGRGDYAITKTVSVNVNRTSDVQYRAFIMGQFTVPGSKGYLPFSLNSTRAVYDALGQSTLDAAGYSFKFMPASPTIENVRAGIKSLAQLTDEDDVTVVYLLAHGSYYENKGYYMQFSNGTEYYANTILNDVKQLSGHVLLVFDSCHSGRALQCSEVSKLRASGGTYQGLNGKGHLSIICGSTDTKSTYYDVNDPVKAYDFFTKAFAQGLGWNMQTDTRMSAMADINGDGQVTVTELFNFARPQTQKLISAYIQLHGKTNFVGDPNQYPSCYIAPGEENLVIWGR